MQATSGQIGRSRNRSLWVLLSSALVVAFLVHIAIGTTTIPLSDILHALFSRGAQGDNDGIILNLRLPRAVACLVVGGILGLAGSALQSLFRNPLADPYVVGVSSGAAVGGATAFVLHTGLLFGGLGMVLFSTMGGILALGLVLALSLHRGTVVSDRLLLAGVMVGSLLSAVLSIVLLAAGQDTRKVLGWLLGSMTQAFWREIGWMSLALVIGGYLLIRQSKNLNVLAIGPDAARRMGVDASRLMLVVLVVTGAMVSITVGSVGIVGFLGLAAPHIARRVVGTDWRGSLIASGILGATMLSLADVIAQWGGMEFPVGIVTAVIGAPFLLVLLRKR